MRDDELTGNAEAHNASSGPVKDDSSRRRTLRTRDCGQSRNVLHGRGRPAGAVRRRGGPAEGGPEEGGPGEGGEGGEKKFRKQEEEEENKLKEKRREEKTNRIKANREQRKERRENNGKQ